MNWPKLALRALGKRLPRTQGSLSVNGIDGAVTIRRDRFGVPHITASSDGDAWYAIGFCHGQDRTFQIETRIRVVRGTLAALIGPDGLPIDRISRRIGFRRYGDAAVEALEPRHRALAEAYAAGVTDGAGLGQRALPHEFVLLRSRPSKFDPADALGFLALQCFVLASNWDAELARLLLLTLDGPKAVADLDPGYAARHPASDRPGVDAGPVVTRLAEDLASLAGTIGMGGGSNNWALAESRTATGRPMLANDPHLAPMLPPHWYLLHITTPEWSLAGASFPGAPAIAAAHNGHAAWGITAGLIDNTDLFLEELGPDGVSVRRGKEYVPCEVHREVIRVRGGDTDTIDVLATDRGPIVSDGFDADLPALSFAATWLDPKPLGRIFDIGRVRSFDDLQTTFDGWNSLPLNVAYADTAGTIGWQFIGEGPVRRRGSGMIPLPAWDESAGWEGTLGLHDLPHVTNPDSGFVATANNLPSAAGVDLGSDFLDGYRISRITEMLASAADWDVAGVLEMQMDQHSIPWRELRTTVLRTASGEDDLAFVTDLLEGWDGKLDVGSPTAALFEVFLGKLIRRVVDTRAPVGARWALGAGFHPLVPMNMFLFRRVSHIVDLVHRQPDGWFPGGWDREIAAALRRAHRDLIDQFGEDPSGWQWGSLRQLTLLHPLGLRPPLDRVYNLGPVPHGGDANTINPAPVDPADPLADPVFAIASLRMVVDIGDWERSRFVLPGGQSGNPFSPNYGDQFTLWQKGDAIPIPWSESEVARAAHSTLVLMPEGRRAD